MKFYPNIQGWRRHRNLSAFTLAEMMMASTIYLVVFVGVMVTIQLVALRFYTLAATKLTATQGARGALNQIRDDIQKSKLIQVGNCTTGPASFAAVSGSNGAVGNALQIFSTTNPAAPYSIYYLQTNTVGSVSSNNLMAYLVATNSSSTVKLITYITNSILFTAEDCYGNTVSNCMKNNQIYTVTLQFYQWEYPIARIGTNGLNMYDYYQLRTKVCRRALD
jgi:Tfp pilus assembly protein PilW